MGLGGFCGTWLLLWWDFGETWLLEVDEDIDRARR